MASLLSDTEINNITGAFGDVFDTFKKDIVVFKEPTKTVVDVDTSFLYGYGAPSNKTNYEYTQVSGIYPALVMRGTMGETSKEKFNYPDNKIGIKVEKDARDFIKQGKTERVIIDDTNYNVSSSDSQVDFLTKKYYIFELEKAN